jgi:cell division protein FtsW
MARSTAVRPRPAEVGERASRFGTGWEAPLLLLATLLLLSFGLVTVYSASAVLAQARGLPDYHFVVRQAIGAAAGVVLLIGLSQVDYRRLRRLAWPLMIVTLAMLVAVVAPGTQTIAPLINGARRWLVLGPVTLQPAEFAKFAILVWTAALAVRKQEQLASLTRGLLPFLIVWALVLMLLFLQPALSTAIIVLLLASLVIFAAGARIGHFILLAVVGLPLLWAQVESVGYRMRRIAAFLDASHDPAGISYQINQSLIAIGSGGVLGRGFGRGQQKFGFLPEPHNDFIFAMIGEEWGLLGTAGIVILFIMFGLVGYRVARQAPDAFGALLAIGLTNLIVVQALLHMAVNVALIPTTGVTLPFLSYGRSSLLVCLMAVGVLLSIARTAETGRRRLE